MKSLILFCFCGFVCHALLAIHSVSTALELRSCSRNSWAHSYLHLLPIKKLKLSTRANRPNRSAMTMSLAPGGQNLDWENLGFAYMQTRSFAKVEYRNGQWGKTELITGAPYIPIHIASTALHYGQACFEGLKAFTGKDEKVRLFRPHENARRMQKSCDRVCMESMPEDRFVEACKEVVRDNLDYVPPYGTKGSLYLRPLLFGSGERIGLA